MTIRDDAQAEAKRQYPGARTPGGYLAPQHVERGAFIQGALWVSEQADREPTEREVEAAAKAAYDRAFLKHAPEYVDRWDDLVADNDVAPESWREVARAALIAAREVNRGH